MSLVAVLATPAWADDPLLVSYGGELIDGDARPLGGVFALEYKLYRAEDASEAIWSEAHYVAVLDGQYEVLLGGTSPLDAEWSGESFFVAVEFLGTEALRERITLAPHVEEDPGDVAALPDGTNPIDPSGQNMTEVTFAQLADRALVAQEAEHAADSDRLAGRTLDEIDRSDVVLEALSQHASDHEMHGGGGSTGIGGSTTVLQRAGGEGGVRYTRMCPSGYVVVGIRGGAGQLVDSVELICAPLE